MLSYGAWVRRFGARPDVVGERIVLGVVSPEEQQPHTIVGVVEPSVLFPEAEPEFLISTRPPPPSPGHAIYAPLLYRGVARIAAGPSPRAAAEQATAVVEGLVRTEPTSVRLVGMVEAQLVDRAWTLWLLFGGAALLLLIACSNVAGLLLGEGRLFGVAALVLAAVGLYGLATRRVAERRHEIGVRVAMGATPGDVRSLVFRDGLAIVTLGLVVGLPAAYAASWTTESFLFGVTPSAPHIFALAAAVLGATALVAMLLPALRASRTDPSGVLRE